MFPNRLTFGALAIACVTAAAAGGYFASRQGSVPGPAVVAEQALSASEAPQQDSPVQETEAVVDNRVSPAPAASEPEAAGRVTPAATARRAPATAPQSTRMTRRPDPPPLERSW